MIVYNNKYQTKQTNKVSSVRTSRKAALITKKKLRKENILFLKSIGLL